MELSKEQKLDCCFRAARIAKRRHHLWLEQDELVNIAFVALLETPHVCVSNEPNITTEQLERRVVSVAIRALRYRCRVMEYTRRWYVPAGRRSVETGAYTPRRIDGRLPDGAIDHLTTDERIDLLHALSSLPPLELEMIRLVFFSSERRLWRDIAVQLGLARTAHTSAAHTLAVRLSKTLDKLRKQLS